jgi:hypothetical protein
MPLYYVSLTLPATITSVPIEPGRIAKCHQTKTSFEPACATSSNPPASRPSRARPTPADLLRASDATGIPFVELLEALWGIPSSRLADELAALGLGVPSEGGLAGLSQAEQAGVADYVAFLTARHARRPRRRTAV